MVMREKVIRPASKAPDKLPTEVTLTTLAKLLGLSLTAAREHADRDVFVKGNGRQFILEASVQSYSARLRKLADGRGGEHAIGAATRARAKLMENQATLTAAKSAKLAGELTEADAVERFWTGKVKAFRNRVLAVPDKLPQSVRPALESELREALNELADAE